MDILQPCVSFNKVNTFADYAQRVYHLPDAYDPTDKPAALRAALEFGDKIPTGIFYNVPGPAYHDKQEVLSGGVPLISRTTDTAFIRKLIKEFI